MCTYSEQVYGGSGDGGSCEFEASQELVIISGTQSKAVLDADQFDRRMRHSSQRLEHGSAQASDDVVFFTDDDRPHPDDCLDEGLPIEGLNGT